MSDKVLGIREIVLETGVSIYNFDRWRYKYVKTIDGVTPFPKPVINRLQVVKWRLQDILDWLNTNCDKLEISEDPVASGRWYIVPFYPVPEMCRKQLSRNYYRIKNNRYVNQMKKIKGELK